MHTRQDYMNGKITHREFYAQFVTPAIKAKVDEALGYKLRNFPHDEHLNDIGLSCWDGLAGSTRIQRSYGIFRPTLRCEGLDGSLASAVCVLKEAAKQLIEESKCAS